MTPKNDTDDHTRTIGARSRFDWFFIIAVIPGVYMVGAKLRDIDNKLNQAVPRAAMVKWSIDMKAQYPQTPIFPPNWDGDR